MTITGYRDANFRALRVAGVTIDWPDFLKAACAFGWKASNTLSKAHAAIAAVEGTEHADEWLKRAKECFA